MGQATMTAIYGRRGAGKTTRALSLAVPHKRVIVFDPMGEWPGLGYRALPWGGLGAILPDKAFRASYKPIKGKAHAIAALHMLSERLFDIQEGRRDRLLLIVDEMSLSFPNHALASDRQGFTNLCEHGRHSHIDVIGMTQRPAKVSGDFRGNCKETYIFALDWVNDVDTICAMIGREHKGLVRGQVDHHFVHYCQNVVTLGENPPKKHKKR